MKSHLTYRVVSSLSLPSSEKIVTLSIDPDGCFLAAGGTSGHVFVWCLRAHKLLCRAAPSGEHHTTDTSVTAMMWLRGGLLFFGRQNGLLGTLRIGKGGLSFLHAIPYLTISQKYIEAASLVAHERSPVCAIAYSEEIQTWATATNNEIRFIKWKRADWCTFSADEGDRIVAKKTILSSELQNPVQVTSLNWVRKSTGVAHLLVSFLHHHVEVVDGITKNVLSHVAIHTPVCRMILSPDQRRALVTNISQGFAIYDIVSAHVLACSRDVPGLSNASPAKFIHNGHAILIGCVDGRATLFDSENGQFMQSLSHEGGGLVSALDGHAFDDPDQFAIATAVNSGIGPTVFIWQTIGLDMTAGQDKAKLGFWVRSGLVILLLALPATLWWFSDALDMFDLYE